MSHQSAAGSGIGARVRRKEDVRHLRGRGQFVGDIQMAGLQEVAFLRSPVAHARILSAQTPHEHADAIRFLDDLAGVSPIVTRSSIPGYKVTQYPPLGEDP